MKRFIAIAALAAFALSACEQKIDIPAEIQTPGGTESSGLVFTATTESAATKATLSDNSGNNDVVWQDGDEITIVDGAATPNVGVYSTESTTTTATYSFKSGNAASASPYEAWYSSSIYNNGTPELPAVQYYAEDNITGVPMMATSGTASLSFKNLTGIIRLNAYVTSGTKTVRRITLSADKGMSGAFTVSADAAVVSGTSGVTLDCGNTGVAINIFLPEAL